MARADGIIKLEEEEFTHSQRPTSTIAIPKPPPEQKVETKRYSSRQEPSNRPKQSRPFTRLIVSLAKLFHENKGKGIFRTPPAIRESPEKRDRNKMCAYHNDFGHNTDECRSLWYQVEAMLRKGMLSQYRAEPKNKASEEGGSKTMTGNIANEELLEINTIHGQLNLVEGKEARSRFEKRRAEKVRRINEITSTSESAKALEKITVISFTQKDMEGIEFPHNDALVVTLRVANSMVKRVMIDRGSSADVLFWSTFKIMKLDENEIQPNPTPIYAFEGTKAQPIEDVTLPVIAAVKSQEKSQHVRHLEEVFNIRRRYHMRLNPKAGQFLGQIVNNRGIEPNPSKVEALRNMPDPRTPRDVQDGSIWGPEQREAFEQLKKYLASPLTLTIPKQGEPLYLYMAVTEIAVNVVLLRKENSLQQPIFYVSKSLIEAEKRYPLAEKLVLALVTAKRKLRQYFEAHTIIVIADFLVECYPPNKQQENHDEVKEASNLDKAQWELYIDGSSNQAGARVGIVLSSLEGVDLEYSVRLDFPASNNVAEYKALVLGLQLARTLKVGHLIVHSNSRLIVGQTTEEYAAKDERIGAYQWLVKDLASRFEKIKFEQIPREMNVQVDRLAHTALASVEDMRVAPVELLSSPSIPIDPGVIQIDAEEETWMTPIMNYLTKGTQPNDLIEARKLRINAARQPAEELNLVVGPWPFAPWGMDIVGPLPTAVGGKKFVLLATDYFTKWVEAEAYKTVTQTDVIRFLWRNIICCFGIPKAIATDKGT
ncbi:unnamed protein product [Prunus armeniaca]